MGPSPREHFEGRKRDDDHFLEYEYDLCAVVPARVNHEEDYDKAAFPKRAVHAPVLFRPDGVRRVKTKTTKMSDEDYTLLSTALDNAKEAEDSEAEEAFADMLKRGKPLTPKQRAWAGGLSEGKFVEAAPEYKNLFSSGLVPRGKEVELPPVLRNLQMKPPGRR